MRLAALLVIAAAALALVLYFRDTERSDPSAPTGDTRAAPKGSPARGTVPKSPGGGKTAADRERGPAPWHLLAHVVDDQGKAVADATVSIWLARDQDTEFLREARTDAEGNVDLDLSVLVGRTRNHLARRRLMGWAFAPGHVLPLGMPSKIDWLFPDHLQPGVWRMDFEPPEVARRGGARGGRGRSRARTRSR